MAGHLLDRPYTYTYTHTHTHTHTVRVFLLNPLTLFHPVPHSLSETSLFHVSVPLFLFCSSILFIIFLIGLFHLA